MGKRHNMTSEMWGNNGKVLFVLKKKHKKATTPFLSLDWSDAWSRWSLVVMRSLHEGQANACRRQSQGHWRTRTGAHAWHAVLWEHIFLTLKWSERLSVTCSWALPNWCSSFITALFYLHEGSQTEGRQGCAWASDGTRSSVSLLLSGGILLRMACTLEFLVTF